MCRRATAWSTLRAVSERRAPYLGQGAGRAGRAPRMGTTRLTYRGTKPQPTPRPLWPPSLATAPLQPPRAVSRPLAYPRAEAAVGSPPSARAARRGDVTTARLLVGVASNRTALRFFHFPPTDNVHRR